MKTGRQTYLTERRIKRERYAFLMIDNDGHGLMEEHSCDIQKGRGVLLNLYVLLSLVVGFLGMT
jgi:hypothetical protein